MFNTDSRTCPKRTQILDITREVQIDDSVYFLSKAKAKMADVLRSGIVHCNDTCGCPVPCPGGAVCRCTTRAYSEYDHKKCSCGEHCSCNPCTCSRIETNKTGKAYCSCGTACTCSTCNA